MVQKGSMFVKNGARLKILGTGHARMDIVTI